MKYLVILAAVAVAVFGFPSWETTEEVDTTAARPATRAATTAEPEIDTTAAPFTSRIPTTEKTRKPDTTVHSGGSPTPVPVSTEEPEQTTLQPPPCPPCYASDCGKGFHMACSCDEGYFGFFCDFRNESIADPAPHVNPTPPPGCKPCKRAWVKKVKKVSGNFGMNYFNWSKFVGKENKAKPNHPNFPPFPPFIDCHKHGYVVCERNVKEESEEK